MTAHATALADTENEALARFRTRAREFMAAEIAPHQSRWRSESGVARAVWEKAGDLGLISPDLPVEYGGGGHDFLYLAALLEERANLDDRSWGISNQAIVVQYLFRHGTPEQKAAYLPKLASGRMIGAIAMTEPHTGSDLKSITTSAVRMGSGYVLSGTKTFISNIRDADLVVVAAKSEELDGTKGVSLLLVETRNAEGYRIVRHLPKIGQSGLDTSEIEFAQVRLPQNAVLGGVAGKGFRQLMGDLPYERMIVAVSALATMERALQLAVDYTKQRQVFGQPLFTFQNTKFKLADMKARCTVARSFVKDCLQRLVAGTLDSNTASIAKLWLSENEFFVVDESLQLFGGNGYVTDHPIAQIFIDARAERIYGGTSEIMKEIISRSL